MPAKNRLEILSSPFFTSEKIPIVKNTNKEKILFCRGLSKTIMSTEKNHPLTLLKGHHLWKKLWKMWKTQAFQPLFPVSSSIRTGESNVFPQLF